jgi:4-amino-4-deoxy-L-arabinose transferase-like glycosyltransferase
MIERIREALAEVPRWEVRTVLALMALSAGVVVAYVLITWPMDLRGDMVEYHSEGVFFTQGRWWWTTSPFGVAHEGMWKAPLYPAWIGFWYELLGAHPERVALVQGVLLAPLTPLLTWMLGRRLFGGSVGVAAAAVVTLLPITWEFHGLLYSEALAIPLTLGALLLILARAPTPRLAIGTGALIGVTILVRPTSVFLLAGLAAAYVVAVGWRRGLGLSALAVIVAALVVLPWTVRNYVVADALIPISIQDAATYGTFNDESANDPEFPYAWRAILQDPPDVLEGPPVGDGELRSELQEAANDYIADHPFSVAEAFFWNGITRLWDVRRPGNAALEAPFEGRSEPLAWVSVLAHYAILALALAGLWLARRRREILFPVIALAVAASIVFTIVSGSRYRAPLEPLLAVLAASAVIRPRSGEHVQRAPEGAATVA